MMGIELVVNLDFGKKHLALVMDLPNRNEYQDILSYFCRMSGPIESVGIAILGKFVQNVISV